MDQATIIGWKGIAGSKPVMKLQEILADLQQDRADR